jgi:hypothetical protein
MARSQVALGNAFTRQAKLGNHFRSQVQLGNEGKKCGVRLFLLTYVSKFILLALNKSKRFVSEKI